MAVHDLYSKRQKHLRGEYPDIYQYDELPPSFRAQVVYILEDVLGKQQRFDSDTDQVFRYIHNALKREYGVLELHRGRQDQEIVFNFLLNATDVEQVLDVIELSFRIAYGVHPRIGSGRPDIVLTPDEAVAELNIRFREHGIGYQFESNQVVRVDSEFIHQEIVKPALHVLRAAHFSGAEKEFLEAHKHYRDQEFEDAISDSLKAFESTLKVICQRQGWAFDENRATASTLIQIIFDNDLIPPYLQSQFNSLQSILESGVPTIRNRDGGHGSGATPRDVPAHLAAYALHLTASAIVFLAEAERVK
ncbi:MAG: hypothetical protein OXH85_02400 [Truepera sp.]|nr:hypothetical protein [Truepera sp.]